jgi:hypothetical protein
MTIAHVAYLFDLEGFKQEFDALRPDLDRGDYASLHARGNAVLSRTPEVWSILNDFHYYEDVKDYEAFQISMISTLAILAQYLNQCPSIDYPTWEVLIRETPKYSVRNWQIVEKGLLAIGWTEQDIRLLVEGKSVVGLMRPDLANTNLINGLPPSKDWYSIGRIGWLDVHEISYLLDRLTHARRDFLNLSPTALPLYEEGHRHISDEQIELAFVYTVGMLKTAQEAVRELLLTLVS